MTTKKTAKSAASKAKSAAKEMPAKKTAALAKLTTKARVLSISALPNFLP